jgi:hypothetical protein
VARSIHDTRGVAFEAWCNARRTGSDADWEYFNKIRGNVFRQRSIKRRLRQQREIVEIPPFDPDLVPISRVHDHFHAVTEADLRAVLRRMPPGTCDGLDSIELASSVDADEEVLPAIWRPSRRGFYSERYRRVCLAGMRCDREPSRHLVHYLRLQTLATFVHELAHHFDFMHRTVGDRWRMDDRDKNEAYARAVAYEHVTTAVVPYLAEQYSEDNASLVAWIEERTGIVLPLELLTDDRTAMNGFVDYGFCSLVREDNDALSALGVGLHFTGYDALASSIANRMLALDPASEMGLKIRAGDLAPLV